MTELGEATESELSGMLYARVAAMSRRMERQAAQAALDGDWEKSQRYGRAFLEIQEALNSLDELAAHVGRATEAIDETETATNDQTTPPFDDRDTA